MQRLGLLVTTLVLLAGCTGPQVSRDQSSSGQPSQPTAPKRITIAVMGDPRTLSGKLNSSGSGNIPGVDALEEMVHAGLGTFDYEGVLQPRVAEALPSIENGLWRVTPDGRMETTWKIRPGVVWHDGTPFTSEDLAFTSRVASNKETALEYVLAFDSVERFEARDASTFTIYWSKPFIGANEMFTRGAGGGRMLAIPKHALERAFNDDKTTFTDQLYWTSEYIGVGPYKVKAWERGSHVVLAANDQYVLGRPRIDEVEVKFFPDARIVGASILAGVVQGTMSRGIPVDQGVEIRDQWKDGRMEVRPNSSIVVFPQFLDPTPAVVTNVNFRRAMLHAIDRKQLTEVLTSGLSQPAESFIPPDDPLFKEMDPYNARYEYSPTRAAQLIEGLGYSKGGDGFYRDGSGLRLQVEIRATAGDETSEKSALAIADYWQRIGVTTEPFIIPEQRQRDRELRATFPAFDIRTSPNEAGRLARFQSVQTALPENRFIGDNNPRYMNPEFDRLIDRFFSTIPLRERNQALGEVMRHLTDQVVIMGLFYSMEPTMMANRLTGLRARHLLGTQAWNAHEWDWQ